MKKLFLLCLLMATCGAQAAEQSESGKEEKSLLLQYIQYTGTPLGHVILFEIICCAAFYLKPNHDATRNDVLLKRSIPVFAVGIPLIYWFLAAESWDKFKDHILVDEDDYLLY